MFPISLVWQRDASGYALSSMGRFGQTIVRNGGEWIETTPLAGYEMHYAEFAGVRTAEDVLKFVNRWGFLCAAQGGYGARFDPVALKVIGTGYEGELVDRHLETARLFRLVVNAQNRGRKIISSKDALALTSLLENEALGEFSLAPDGKRGFRFIFQATSMMNALWIQLAQKTSSGVKIQTCGYCGALFEVGVGTGKRADAAFCTTSHRVAFSRKARRD